ncbi:MAG: hypothetical protein ACI8XU_002797 [Kiritimatiellia bacterium]|jgi:hypothetical protein
MKGSIGLLFAAIVLVGGFTYSEMQQSSLLTQQIDDYVRQNSQLLTQIENNALKNSESAKTLRSLQDELKSRESQLAALSRQLETAQQQIDPDYQQIETRIRQQLTSEIQASNNVLNLDPRIALLKQLSELDPMVMGEIMSLNSQYGEFIKGLNVSEEREEVIINALHNMIADQNQARGELMLEMQTADPQVPTRADLFNQMRAVSDSNSQLEALAYDLTASELDAFAEFQEQRQETSISFGPIGETSGVFSGGPTFFEGGIIQSGSGQSGAVQILPINPGN